MVIDNFSRFVLAHRVTEEIGADGTVSTLRAAQSRASELLHHTPLLSTPNVYMDPGTENNNHTVLNYISSNNLVRTLARVEVHYSNSMIESLFRSLKSNYLCHQGIRSIQDLERKVAYYIHQHNHIIPLSVHDGGIPREVFESKWNEEMQQQLERVRLEARMQRHTKNRLPSCGVCPD